MRKKSITSSALALAFVFLFVSNPTQASAQSTWRKFETVTESFENFMRNNPMGNKYDSSMNAIRNVTVRSEAEAVLVSDSSGTRLTYTERTIFEPSGFNSAVFRLAWGPMQRRYPIEMWTELRERTNDGIREWIRGGDGTGTKHGDVDKDLIWIVESGFAGAGAATGWGFDVAKNYSLGRGAAINCTPSSSSTSFVITITIPLTEEYFNVRNGRLSANLSFHDLISDILKTSKLFRSDTFIMTESAGD